MGKDKIMDEQKVKRINELYRKSKAEGLTDAWEKERTKRFSGRNILMHSNANLRSQLNNIDVEEKDGTIVNLGEKFGKQKRDIRKRCYAPETG